jgi:hypothetical protein
MKKALITSLILSQLLGSLAMAGLSRFDSSQFNEIIAENQKQEKELRRKLQDEAGVDYKLHRKPLRIDRKEVVGEEAEQIAVTSSQPEVLDSDSERSSFDDQESMKRLSQELDQAGQ